MASWETIEFNFDIFDPLKPPLEAVLVGLEVVEAILEALLDLIKPFMLDLLNPLRAIIAALLAAIRAIINQIRASGFSILLVHPDFSIPDYSGVLYSVSGAYPGFESKVVAKFFDTSDIFRPQYPPGSSVAMLILYLGADSPGDLMGLIFALLDLIKHPIDLSGIPAPVDLKVRPVRQGSNAISQFRSLFEDGIEKSLEVEWRMPQMPVGTDVKGFANTFVSFFNQFRFPNFIVERTGPFPQEPGTSQLAVKGETTRIEVNSLSQGKIINSALEKYKLPTLNSKIVVREEDGSVHRVFPNKRVIQYGSDGEAKEGNAQGNPNSATAETVTALVTGIGTGIYKFLDNDKDLKEGKTYYYRVRGFFGDATDYLSMLTPADVEAQDKPGGFLKKDGNRAILKWGPDLTMGKPSRTVKGFVPRNLGSSPTFNVYVDVFNAIRAGLLLNFELPAATQQDEANVQAQALDAGLDPNAAGAVTQALQVSSTKRTEQKSGWGSLGSLGGQIGPIKAAFSNSEDLKKNLLFNATARRLANAVATELVASPEFTDVLASQWTSVKGVVEGVLAEAETNAFATTFVSNSTAEISWTCLGLIGGITGGTQFRIEEYLAREESYGTDHSVKNPYPGPLPLGPDDLAAGAVVQQGDKGLLGGVSVQGRIDLATFIRAATSLIGQNSSYLSWYSVTVGDLFPILTPFLEDFLQWLEALLKAINSALQELIDIIETLLQKVRALIQLVEMILAILDLLDITIRVSILATSSTNGSAGSLAQELISSENKPGDSPFGLHSGMVMTFGGPGQGFIAALEVLGFILGFGGNAVGA